jgi:ferredoxin-NADP reductase
MAGTALLGRLTWRLGRVTAKAPETPRSTTLVLAVPGWPGHRPGQHVDVRLTAEDGYQAERSYSIGSAPDGELVALTVDRIDDGEVSPYLVDELRVGDRLELRGPVGGYFVWEPPHGGPLQLVAGGSGVVPLMSMLRQRAASGAHVPARLLFSARTVADLIYRHELEQLARADQDLRLSYTLTRERPAGWDGYSRRIDRAMLEEAAWPPSDQPLVYVCGPTRLVESAADALVELGHDRARVWTERFGPTGV